MLRYGLPAIKERTRRCNAYPAQIKQRYPGSSFIGATKWQLVCDATTSQASTAAAIYIREV